jgi:hypothetical protein
MSTKPTLSLFLVVARSAWAAAELPECAGAVGRQAVLRGGETHSAQGGFCHWKGGFCPYAEPHLPLALLDIKCDGDSIITHLGVRYFKVGSHQWQIDPVNTITIGIHPQ